MFFVTPLRASRYCSSIALASSLVACQGEGSAAQDSQGDNESAKGSEPDKSPGNDADSNQSDPSKGNPKGKSSPDEPAPDSPTWHEHVAPIIVKHCAGCHKEGAIAPFRLDRYQEAKDARQIILRSIEDGTMPPFLAHDTDRCSPPLPWLGDYRLSANQIETIRRWVDNGAPQGDASKSKIPQPPPEPKLDKIDLTVKTGQSITVGGNKDQFKCVTVDPGFTKDTWVNGAQFIPGNTNVLHHAIAYIDDRGESKAKGPMYDCFGGPQLSSPRILSSWAPGAQPMQTPKDSAIKIPAGARIVLNLHFHPTGNGDEIDKDTALALSVHEGAPKIKAENIFIGNFETPLLGNTGLHPGPNDDTGIQFRIPANAKGHTEHMQFGIPTLTDIKIWLVATHMHYVGRKARIWIEHAGQEQCLIDTPEWDFNWQMGYAYEGSYDEYPTIRPGDSLHIECEYDNSLDNPFVRDALKELGKTEPVEVRLGEETLDEMCLGTIGLLAPNDGQGWNLPGLVVD